MHVRGVKLKSDGNNTIDESMNLKMDKIFERIKQKIKEFDLKLDGAILVFHVKEKTGSIAIYEDFGDLLRLIYEAEIQKMKIEKGKEEYLKENLEHKDYIN